MCEVIAFDRTKRAADEAAKRASLLGYGLAATQTFQREAVRLARVSNMQPAQIARHAVPSKSATFGNWFGGDAA